MATMNFYFSRHPNSAVPNCLLLQQLLLMMMMMQNQVETRLFHYINCAQFNWKERESKPINCKTLFC